MNITTLYVIFSIVVYFIYIYKSKYIGLFISIVALFMLSFVPFVYNYKTHALIKNILIISTSIFLFIGIINKCANPTINLLVSWLFKLNFFVLIFTPIHILLRLALFIVSITTPDVNIKNEKVMFIPNYLSIHSWIILSTVVLFLFYNLHMFFWTNSSYYIILFALLLPFIAHFVFNKYLEARALSLCLYIIFDTFNHNKNAFEIVNMLLYNK